ncbi:AMMECR1-like protein [Watersipora subatra]|uniref:AMMECR1-like protein n=1 Tax=Watersipora subatra TaxID=2589382 RepID=UPI00355BCB37
MSKKPRLVENGYSSGIHNGYTHKDRTVSREMAYFCFETLLKHLRRQPTTKQSELSNFTNDPYPLFVTWNTGRERHLRGCIGTFTPLKLHQGLKEYAITSAIRDSRFSPITLDEVSKLSVTVSILLNFEDAGDYLDWEVGKHGIRIEFVNERGQHKTATYLPDVSVQQGWNKLQTIDSLLRKGGHKGHISQQLRSSIKLVRYQSEKVQATYDDYKEYIGNEHSEQSASMHGLANGHSC